MVFGYLVQNINSAHNALGILARNACFAASLATYCNVKCFVALSSKLVKCYILADFNSAFDFNTELADNIDFRFNNIFLKLVRRNSVCKHTAGFFVLFKNGGSVTGYRKIICA